MKRTQSILAACLALAGCASSGVIPTGPDTYMLTKKGAGGVFSSGNAVLGDLYLEANQFCNQRGQVVQTVTTNAQNAIPFARVPNATLDFKCVTRPAVAASAPGA
jgi:hypothetical protein